MKQKQALNNNIGQNETNSSQKVQLGMHKIQRLIIFLQKSFQILNQ
jgi:hypothetical protein